MHAKVGGGSRRSSMGIGPQKSNPLLLLSVLGRVQCPLKTQTIFIPKSPGSSPPLFSPLGTLLQWRRLKKGVRMENVVRS